MSIAAHKKLLTAEEFFVLPEPQDGSQQELERGEIVTMPPPGGLHGVCCLKVGRRIGNFVEEHRLGTVTSNDTGFITERGPDISFWSRERLPSVPVGYIETAPDMLVEVLSPSNPRSKFAPSSRNTSPGGCGWYGCWRRKIGPSRPSPGRTRGA